MPQSKNKRRRKRRGTQGGRIDSGARRSRPRTREEAKQRARAGGNRPAAKKKDLPPTWKGAAIRGIGAAVIFAFLLLVFFKRPLGVALGFGAFMLVFYIPTGYYIDLTMWRKRERKRIRDREGTS